MVRPYMILTSRRGRRRNTSRSISVYDERVASYLAIITAASQTARPCFRGRPREDFLAAAMRQRYAELLAQCWRVSSVLPGSPFSLFLPAELACRSSIRYTELVVTARELELMDQEPKSEKLLGLTLRT